MKLQTITYCFLIIISTAWHTYAQDYRDDFKKIKAAYSSGKSISVDVSYKYFSNPAEKNPEDTLSGHLVMYENNYAYRIGSFDIIKNDKCFLTVDHSHKEIILGKMPQSGALAVGFDILDSLVQQNEVSISYNTTHSDEGAYTITKTAGNPCKYIIVFDRHSYLVKELDICYRYVEGKPAPSNAQPQLCLYYSHHKESAPDPSVFSEAKYITAQNKTVVPVAAYRSYKIINNLNP